MRKGILAGVLAAAVAGPAVADVWDVGSDTDNNPGTDNEIVHGLDQVHDMASQNLGLTEDVDWYRFQAPYATSWEIVLDGLTGDLSNSPGVPALEVIESDGSTVAATGTPLTSFGVAQHVTDYNLSLFPDEPLYVRVSGPACGLLCGASDQYRIRAYETTLFVPRYNNSNGQVTVLALQNNSGEPVSGWVYAHGPGGSFPGYFPFYLVAYEAGSFNLASVAAGILNNTAGALRIIHLGSYGQLSAKAVAVEPSTGFTFDTQAQPRPH